MFSNFCISNRPVFPLLHIRNERQIRTRIERCIRETSLKKKGKKRESEFFKNLRSNASRDTFPTIIIS